MYVVTGLEEPTDVEKASAAYAKLTTQQRHNKLKVTAVYQKKFVEPGEPTVLLDEVKGDTAPEFSAFTPTQADDFAARYTRFLRERAKRVVDNTTDFTSDLEDLDQETREKYTARHEFTLLKNPDHESGLYFSKKSNGAGNPNVQRWEHNRDKGIVQEHASSVLTASGALKFGSGDLSRYIGLCVCVL